MKASELIVLLQERIAEFGDRDMCTIDQTGADSFQIIPVTDVIFGTHDGRLIIE